MSVVFPGHNPAANLSLRLLQALWFALPVFAAGLIHVCVIKFGWFSALARQPLDRGAMLRRRRLLGDNKTVRGAVVMIVATAMVGSVLAQASGPIYQQLAVAPFQIAHPALWGLLLGAGYVLGELPNSAVKRQLDIAPGTAGCGWKGCLFWVLDQLDSVVGAFLLVSIVWRPDIIFVAIVLGLALLLHPFVAALMVVLGLKTRIG